MAMRVRRGNEVDFDPNKMLPGEWAVSLDTKYVRMCFSPGICLRMATYEAFEADMAEIQSIMAEARTIEEAVARIQTEINDTAIVVEDYAILAKSYAVGGTGTRENEEVDNAKYYYEQSKHISQGGNGLVPLGTIAFENLPTEDILINGMYNISNDFTSDERFIDGGGVLYGKGSNVYYTVNGLWDVLAASDVKGVRGSAESLFRQGNVTISPDDLGLGGVLPLLGNTDISNIGDGTVTGAVSELNISTKQLFSGAFRFFVYDYSEYEPYESYIKEALADVAKNNCCCMVRIKFKYSMNRDYIGSAVAYYAMFDEITYYNNTKRRFKYANGEWEVIELATQAQINNINSNLDSFMNITTAPKIVGLWNGKPVYEQIFRGTISPNETTTTMDASIRNNSHQLVSAYGEVINESGSKAQIGAYLSPTSYSGVYIGTSKLELYHSTGNQYYNATVRYIKL